MNNELLPVIFDESTLFLVDNGGEPVVPMKPIVEGMGLSWGSQHTKLADPESRWNSVIPLNGITASDGKKYNMLCMPLKKLPGWLMSIEPSRVKQSIRPTIIKYQNKCDDVLWDYWNKRSPSLGGASKASISSLTRDFHALTKLGKEMGLGDGTAKLRANNIISEQQGIDLSKLLDIDLEELARDDFNIPQIDQFWGAYNLIIKQQDLNHSRNVDTIAINLREFVDACWKFNIKLPTTPELKRYLKQSKQPEFIQSNKTITSILTSKSIRCWTFKVITNNK